jgi:hypothetical protein
MRFGCSYSSIQRCVKTHYLITIQHVIITQSHFYFSDVDTSLLDKRRKCFLNLIEEARNIVIDRNIKVQEENRLKKEKEDAKELAVSEKRRAADLASQVADGTLQGRRETTSTRVGCNNECGAIRRVVIEGTVVADDGWIGCEKCPLWFCSKILCKKRFKKHFSHCLVVHQ